MMIMGPANVSMIISMNGNTDKSIPFHHQQVSLTEFSCELTAEALFSFDIHAAIWHLITCRVAPGDRSSRSFLLVYSDCGWIYISCIVEKPMSDGVYASSCHNKSKSDAQ